MDEHEEEKQLPDSDDEVFEINDFTNATPWERSDRKDRSLAHILNNNFMVSLFDTLFLQLYSRYREDHSPVGPLGSRDTRRCKLICSKVSMTSTKWFVFTCTCRLLVGGSIVRLSVCLTLVENSWSL